MEEGSLFQRMKQIFHEDEMDEEMQKEAAGLIRNIFRYMDKDAKDIMTQPKKYCSNRWRLVTGRGFAIHAG